MVMDDSEVQLEKVFASILLIDEGRETVFNKEHLSKAPAPMAVTDEGIAMDANILQ